MLLIQVLICELMSHIMKSTISHVVTVDMPLLWCHKTTVTDTWSPSSKTSTLSSQSQTLRPWSTTSTTLLVKPLAFLPQQHLFCHPHLSWNPLLSLAASLLCPIWERNRISLIKLEYEANTTTYCIGLNITLINCLWRWCLVFSVMACGGGGSNVQQNNNMNIATDENK